MNSVEKLLDHLPKADVEDLYAEAMALRTGNGGLANFALAHSLFCIAALMGKYSARYQLGLMNLRGEGRPKDKLRALMWFKLAQGRGEPRAAGNLKMVAADLNRADIRQAYQMAAKFPEAEEAFRRSRRDDDIEAKVLLGEMLMQGRGVDRDPQLATAWLMRLLPYRHAAAQWQLGLSYLNGEGAEKNPEEGRRLLKQAADQGHAGAQYDLADLIFKQKGWAERPQAYVLLEAAAAQGHALSQYRLAMLHKEGEAPLSESVTPATVSRVAPSIAPSATSTATPAISPRPTKRGTAPHSIRALAYLTQAAQQSHTEAQFELGQMYAQGLGTQQDFEQAAHWYLEAAQAGHAKAQFNLGFLYAHGQGVEQDYVKAFEWYRISDACGYQLAKEHAELIAKKLALDVKEIAQWRADSFMFRLNSEDR